MMRKRKPVKAVSDVLSAIRAETRATAAHAKAVHKAKTRLKDLLNAKLEAVRVAHDADDGLERLKSLRVRTPAFRTNKIMLGVEGILVRPLTAALEPEAFARVRKTLVPEIRKALADLDPRMRLEPHLFLFHTGPGKELGNYESGIGW